MKKTIGFLLLFIAVHLHAQEPVSRPGGAKYLNLFSIQIQYRKGYSAVDPLYENNKESLDSMFSILDELETTSFSTLKSISIKGSASPDGCLEYNRKLSEKRAMLLRDYILENTSVPSSAITVGPSDIDWSSLSQMIASADLPWSDDAVSIIKDTPIYLFDKDKNIVDGRKNRLGMLRGGCAWAYMKSHFFKDMRNADISIVCTEDISVSKADTSAHMSETPEDTVMTAAAPIGADDTIKDTIATTSTEIIYELNAPAETETVDTETESPEAEETVAGKTVDTKEQIQSMEEADAIETILESAAKAAKRERRFTALLKTNMLYDAVAVPNIGIEIPIGKNWSVGADWMYAWWNINAKNIYWRIYGGDLEVRRWFPPRKEFKSLMCGHHVGVYGQMATYDFEWGGTGNLSDKWTWGIGLSYGYSLPVSEHFNIDFTVGIGYLQGRYMKYHPQDNCYVWDSTHIRKWFGPTRAEISLVWFIGGRNERKGGAR